MGRMKTFGKYLLWLVLFYIFATVTAYGYIRASYKGIDGVIIKNDQILVTVDTAEASLVNGRVSGKIKNTSQENIQTTYIKLDLISKRENLILTKYVQVDDLKAGEEKEFNVEFRAENIAKYKIEITDKAEVKEGLSELINIKDLGNDATSKLAIFIAAIILIRYLI